MEQAAKDSVHATCMACKDRRVLPSAGATKMELAVKIKGYSDTCPVFDQYAQLNCIQIDYLQ
eukprot:14405949-Ditylum_brightwellii.AAC.1